MIELFDNLLQLAVVLLGCVWSGVLYLRSRRTPHFLLCCFYGCFALALLYWTLYFVLFGETPYLFYVSELIWIAGCVLLYLLQYTVFAPPRSFRCPAAYLAPLIGAVLLAVYFLSRNVFSGILRCTVMTALAWDGIRALAVLRTDASPEAAARRRLHRAVLVFVVLENCLWLSSKPWRGDTLANPYFWIDFALTACLAALLPLVRKAAAL